MTLFQTLKRKLALKDNTTIVVLELLEDGVPQRVMHQKLGISFEQYNSWKYSKLFRALAIDATILKLNDEGVRETVRNAEEGILKFKKNQQ